MLNGLRQLGFVAGDVLWGAEQWIAATGAGPFFLLEGVRFADWRAHGVAQDMVLDIAFGQSGATMIEVIRPRGDWPCIYGERPLARDAMIPHHHGFLVDDPDGTAVALGLGEAAVSAALGPGTALRYFDLRASLGMVIELIEDSEASRGFFELARSAAEGWTGEDPLRPLAWSA